MYKYVELAIKSKKLVRYDVEDEKLGRVEVFEDGDFRKDSEITEIVEKAFKFNVLSSLGRELSEDEINQAVSGRIAAFLDKKSEERR